MLYDVLFVVCGAWFGIVCGIQWVVSCVLRVVCCVQWVVSVVFRLVCDMWRVACSVSARLCT